MAARFHELYCESDEGLAKNGILELLPLKVIQLFLLAKFESVNYPAIECIIKLE